MNLSNNKSVPNGQTIISQFKLNKWLTKVIDRAYSRPLRLHRHLKSKGMFNKHRRINGIQADIS